MLLPESRPGRRNVALLPTLCVLFSMIAGVATASTNFGTKVPLSPTLQWEIRQGYAVANFCHSKSNGTTSNAFDQCLGMSIRGQTNNPHTHYFMLGLEFGCWRLSDISEGKYAALYYFELRSYQKKLGVSDDQLLKATKTHETAARARLAYWAKHRPTRTVDLR